MGGFKDKNSKWEKVENEIAKHFKNKGFKIYDLRNSEKYRKKDVDFLLQKNKKNILFEVKADEQISKTKNILIEYSHERDVGFYEGWYHYCQADVICYHDVVNELGYLLNWKNLKRGIKNKIRFMEFWNKEDKCWTQAYLVPIRVADSKHWIMKKYKLKE
jgi:hypothetical protein